MVALTLHPLAQCDLEAAANYFEHRGRALAGRFGADVETGFARIQQFPEGWPRHRGNLRRYPLDHFRYGIIYEFHAGECFVYGVGHLQRREGWWEERLHDRPWPTIDP